MMETYELRTNVKKNQWAQACFRQPTAKRQLLKGYLGRQASWADTSQRDKGIRGWQQLFHQWRNQHISRQQVIINKLSKFLGLLGIDDKITAPYSQFFSPQENEVSFQPYHYVSVQNVVI